MKLYMVSSPIQATSYEATQECSCSPDSGRTLYVAKEIVDFEKSLRELQPQWMTSKQKDWFEEGRVRLAAGMGLPTVHHLDRKP